MNTRIGVRIPASLRKKMEDAVTSGKFANISNLIRQAVEKFLNESGCV